MRFLRLFPIASPVKIDVEARQFPVAPYFERRTPNNYLQAVFRKVCKIHESKPPGTILVFVTGRREVGCLLLSFYFICFELGFRLLLMTTMQRFRPKIEVYT